MSGLVAGDTVERINSDYSFKGRVVAKFNKFDRDLSIQNGPERVVVQDDRGTLFVMNEAQLRKTQSE